MSLPKKGIAILGSTGSIGTQALEVIEAYPDKFDLQVLTANRNADLLIKQALKFHPNAVVIADESQFEKVKDALWEEDIHVFAGSEALKQVVEYNEVDIVLTAMVGYAGLEPTLSAIYAKKTIALANKETLVVAGELITKEAKAAGVNIYPVDSEHSAIFQCLAGEYGVGAVGDHFQRSTFFECVGCGAERTGGINHIVNQNRSASLDIADQVHDLRLIGARSALVDDC